MRAAIAAVFGGHADAFVLVGVSVRPAVQRDRGDFPLGVETVSAQHAVEVRIDILLEVVETHFQQSETTRAILVLRR